MSEIHEKLEQFVDKMPAFPSSVHQILQLTSDVNSNPKDLISVIENDPVLTLRILKLVNSAYFGLSREVTSIKKSVVYIGLNSIKNVAISIAAIGALPTANKVSGYLTDKFWLHSLSTATISRLLARHQGVPETELSDYFVASLLHDIGQLTLALFLPAPFKQAYDLAKEKKIPIHEMEISIIGEDHAIVGAILAEKWKLPKSLIHCIRHHHHLADFEDVPVLDKVVFVANQVSKMIVSESHRISEVEAVPDYIQQWLGMPLEDVAPKFPYLNDEILKSRAFIAIGQ